MAIGLGRIFGFHFLENFDHPYIAVSITIYAHVMEEADQRNADVLADVFLKKA